MLVFDRATGRAFYSKRRRRFESVRMPHELTFSCYKRMRLLDRDRTRQWFVQTLSATRRRWPIDL